MIKHNFKNHKMFELQNVMHKCVLEKANYKKLNKSIKILKTFFPPHLKANELPALLGTYFTF